jgi:hypothetical protein
VTFLALFGKTLPAVKFVIEMGKPHIRRTNDFLASKCKETLV